MKWIISVFAFLFAALSVSAQELPAPKVSVAVNVDVTSGYVFRGYVIGELDKVAVQPSISAQMDNLSFGANANAFVQDREMLKGNDEIEVYAEYTWALDKLNLSAGFIQDIYFSDGPDSTNTASDVYAALSLDSPLSPTLAAYRNFSDMDRWNYDWYISLSADTNRGWLDFAASIGVSDTDGEFGFHDVTGKASVTIPMMGAVTLSPGVQCVYLDPDTQHYVFVIGVSF